MRKLGHERSLTWLPWVTLRRRCEGQLARFPTGFAPHVRSVSELTQGRRASPLAMTDALFAELRRPHESYPALIPPVIAWSLMLRSRLAGLPSLPRLGGRLDALNASVLN